MIKATNPEITQCELAGHWFVKCDQGFTNITGSSRGQVEWNLQKAKKGHMDVTVHPVDYPEVIVPVIL